MAGKEEGIYASSKSIDVGKHETDHGLTLHPKTKSRDATHLDNAHGATSGVLKDVTLPLFSIGLQGDNDASWSNPTATSLKSQPNHLYAVKRRRLDTDTSSGTPQVNGSDFEASTRSVGTSSLNLQEFVEHSPQRSWSTLSLQADGNAVDWEFLTEDGSISPDLLLVPHFPASSSHGHGHACQEVSHHYSLFDDRVSRPVKDVDIKKETSPKECQIRSDDRAVCVSPMSDHVELRGNKQKLVDLDQTTHHADKNAYQNQEKTHTIGFLARSGVNSWGSNIPKQSIKRDFHDLEAVTNNDKSVKNSLPSRCSRAAAVAYGVSCGFFKEHRQSSKPDPFRLANQKLRNPRNQDDSSQTPPVLPQSLSVATRNPKSQQSSAVPTTKNLLQDHVIPANLRIQFDALVKKYHQDTLFRQSVDAYIMENSELTQSPDNGAAEVTENTVPDPLDGKSLAEVKSMYKTLEGRFERLRLVTKEMSEDRLHDRNEIQYLKSIAKKVPGIADRKTHGPARSKRPSDETWVCRLPIKRGKICDRKNLFYKQVVIWIKKKSCSSCNGYINNVREGFEYDQLAEIIDSYDTSFEGDDENGDSSHPSHMSQQGALENATSSPTINNQVMVNPPRIHQEKISNIAQYTVNALFGCANNSENHHPQLTDSLVTNMPHPSFANLPHQGDPFVEINLGSRNLSKGNYELASHSLHNMASQQLGFGEISGNHNGSRSSPGVHSSPTMQAIQTMKRATTLTENQSAVSGSSLPYHAMHTQLEIGHLRLKSPQTPALASPMELSATSVSASQGTANDSARAKSLPRKSRPSLDPKLFRTFGGEQWSSNRVPLNPVLGQADKSTSSSRVELNHQLTAKKLASKSGETAKSTKLTDKNLAQRNAVVEKIVPKTAPTKRKASENAPSKKISPKKVFTETQRQMIEETNDVSELFSGRRRKSWEGSAKHAKPKKVIEISSDEESDSGSSLLSDLDSLFEPREEHETIEVANREHLDKNVMDSEDDLRNLENALLAALESDRLINSQGGQADILDRACDHEVTGSPFPPVDNRETANTEDPDELKTNSSRGPIRNIVTTAVEESEESEEE